MIFEELKTLFDLKKIDRIFGTFLRLISSRFRIPAIVLSFLIYAIVMIFFGELLNISLNYFILLPLLAISFVYGFSGGLISGILALPLNYFSFYLMGHLEYLPANLYITEVFGIIVGAFSGYLSEFFYRLIDENERRKATEQQLRDALEEKDLLFRELNHRVKNNLNIIKSLIQLQANRVDDSFFKEECGKVQDRIFSISLVHDQLYQKEQSSNQDLSTYLDSLLDNILKSLGHQKIELTRHWAAGNLSLDNDRTLYLGLIVHEVIMNSIKYGAVEGKILQIRLMLEGADDGRVRLVISDNGPGFDTDYDSNGLGLRLVKTLSMQLGAESTWRNSEGTVFSLTI